MADVVFLQMKVIPNAPKNAIAGWEEGRLKIRLRAVPEKGKANEALIEFLSDWLEIPRSQISIVSGQTSRLKRVKIEGLSQTELEKKIAG